MKNFDKLTNTKPISNDGNNNYISQNVKKENTNLTSRHMPSMAQMAKNVTKALVDNIKHISKGGSIKNSTENTTERLKICMSCEFYIQSKDRCTKCGCKMKIKTNLVSSKCPVGKW